MSATPVRDGVVVTCSAAAISNFGDSEVRVQTPRAGGTGWRSKRPVSFFPRLRPAIRRYLLTTCRGEGDCCKRPCCLLMALLSGEPAGDQGTRLGKPPRREIPALLCAHLDAVRCWRWHLLPLLCLAGPLSGVMSFFPWRRSRTRASWRLGARVFLVSG